VNVIDFIYKQQGEKHTLFLNLNNFIIDYPNITTAIKYGIPFYEINKAICYINGLKPRGVEVVFWAARLMKRGQPFIDFKDRKRMAGITFNSPEEINYEVLDLLINEAIELDLTFQ